MIIRKKKNKSKNHFNIGIHILIYWPLFVWLFTCCFNLSLIYIWQFIAECLTKYIRHFDMYQQIFKPIHNKQRLIPLIFYMDYYGYQTTVYACHVLHYNTLYSYIECHVYEFHSYFITTWSSIYMFHCTHISI